MRVLIADDDKNSRILLRKELEHVGYTVEVVTNGKEALAAAKLSAPDMIISDILMPEMDGFKLLREVKKDELLNKIPFVFYTATFIDPEDKRFANSLGVSRYIIKPMEPDEFLRNIDAVLKESEEKTLAILEPSETDEKLSEMYADTISRKLQKKIKELKLLRKVFNNINEAVIIIDPQGFYIEQNPTHATLFGYSDGDLIGKTPGMLIGTKVFCKMLKDLSEKGIYHEEVISYTKRGQKLYIDLISFPVFDEKGKVLCYTGIKHDITERKKAEKALKASEEKYMALFDNSTDAIFILNSKGRFVEVNDVACQTLGYSKEELLTMSPEDIERKPMIHVFEDILKRVKDEGVIVIERVNFTKDGRKIPVEVRQRLVEYNGAPALMALVHDITDRKRAEEERRKDYMNRIGVMVVAINSDGTIAFVNKAGCEFLGYERDELISKSWLDTIIPEACNGDAKSAFCSIGYSDEGVADNFNSDVKRKDGEIRPVKWNRVPMFDDNGDVAGTICTGEDITKLKKTEEEKEELWKQLLNAQKMESIGRLTSGIAHDFNNLLQTTIGFSTLIESGLADDDPKKEMIVRIHNSGERAAKLIDQLLVFSRRQVLDIKALNPNVTIKIMRDMCSRMIGEDVTIDVSLEPSINHIMADETQLEQVLMNLIVNARDAMLTSGKITITSENVTIDAGSTTKYPGLQEGEYVEISVKDTGYGISAATREKIFDPFFTTKEEGKGTGLGLSTVFGIVEQHNGAIYVESEINVGTEFSLYFPVAEKAEIVVKKQTVCNATGGTETILIAEDDHDIMLLFSMTLKAEGYKIIEAENGEQALEESAAYDGQIDLLLSDLIMPGMDGFELSREILKTRPAIKAVFVSGFAGDSKILRTLKTNSIPYMKKPITPKRLANKVREVLDSS